MNLPIIASKFRILLLLTALTSASVIPVTAQDLESDVLCAGCPAAAEIQMVPAPEVNAYPTPVVTQLSVDEGLVYDRRYQRLMQAVDVYDAPNGNIIRSIDAGFNFVTTQGAEGDWTMINNGEWVPSAVLGNTLPSTYSGVLLGAEPLPYPMGWVLLNVVPSREPGAEPVDGDLAFLRYQRVNLYTFVELDGWRWYQVGVNQWIHQTKIAKYLPVQRPAEVNTQKWISVDLYEQVLIAYDGETPVFTTLVSSGLAEWPTREGLFNVYVRYPRTIMSGANGQPDFYFLEEVPWTMYFDGDIGLHGTYWHDGFGYRHSHGCVNMSIMDSNWLYQWASSEFDFSVPNDTGAAVYVYSSGQYVN